MMTFNHHRATLPVGKNDMPAPMRLLRSDRETLRLLLEFAKMPSGEAAPFNQMYEELVGGRRADLTDTERRSVQSAFDRYRVANLQYPSHKNSYQRAQDSAAAAFDAMPRPKRPPGK
jgi:hypothetical protein